MLLLCALIVGSSSAWAEETVVKTFDSDAVVDNSAYADSYGGDDWSINMGGNNKSIGFNNKNCVTIGDALGTSATATNYCVVVKSKVKINNVNKITFVYTGGSGDGGKLYLAYSADGSTWSAISLNTGSGLSAQGVTLSQNTTFTFEFSTISSAYYGLVLDKGNTTTAAYRFDYVTVNFINVPSSSSAAAKPTFSPEAGELTKAQNVTISSEGAAKIIYTTNGDEPTIGGETTTMVNSASASVLVNANMTIKAKGVDSSNEPSTLATATYTINIAEPVILPEERTYTTTTNVSFTQSDNIDVYYTIDGTNPTSSSTKYVEPFAITENVTVKAIAIDQYGNASDVVEAMFKNSELQATEITINNWNTLFGTSFNGTVNDKKDYSGTQDGVTVTYKEATNMYIKNDDLRIYNGSELIFEAPAGYAITEMAFEGTSSSEKAPTANVGEFNYSTKKWTGFATSVSLSRDSGSGYTKFTSVTIKLVQIMSITITAAEYATYCNATKALDFSETGIKVFTATDGETSVKLNEITSGQVPANTPVVLYKEGADGTAIDVPVIASAEAISGTNDLHVVGAGGLKCEETGEDFIYVLAKPADTVGFFLWDRTKTLNEGKIYLQGKASYGARSFLGFEEGNTTSIDVRSKMEDVRGEVYNLNGQRVAQPTKGLYIVNGKKVVVK